MFDDDDEEIDVEKVETSRSLESVSYSLGSHWRSWSISQICKHFSTIFTYPVDTVAKGCMAFDIPFRRCLFRLKAPGYGSLFRGFPYHFIIGTLWSMSLIGCAKLLRTAFPKN